MPVDLANSAALQVSFANPAGLPDPAQKTA